jgi:cyclic beta-1,2-glucan synthetase
VVVENPDGVNRGVVSADVDGVELTERPPRAPLVDDGAIHQVKVRLG